MKKILITLLLLTTAISCKDNTEKIEPYKPKLNTNIQIINTDKEYIDYYDFKKTEINEVTTTKLRIKSEDATKVKLSIAGEDKDNFKVNVNDINVVKGVSTEITISFTPKKRGEIKAKLVAKVVNSKDSNSVNLTGFGTDYKTNPVIEAGKGFLYALSENTHWHGASKEIIDINNDREIQVSEAKNFKGHLTFFFSHEIKDFKPLKYFPNITGIDIDIDIDSDISELDFSKFKNLTTIDLRTKKAFELNFPKNIENLELDSFDKEFRIKKIDLSNYKNLKTLTIESSGLESIDLSKNILLEKIDFSSNNIESLDLSTLSNLKIIRLGFNESLNSLTLPTNPTSIKEIDLERSYHSSEFNCSNMPNLEKLNLGSNRSINSIIGMSSAMKELNIQYNPISQLNLQLPNLEYLNVRGTNIEELNFNNTPKIKSLTVENSPIKTNLIGFKYLIKLEFVDVSDYDYLDFSKMTELKKARFKEIITLDLSNNRKLEFVYIESQKIESLNLANGKNKVMSTSLSLGDLIECIKIDKEFDPKSTLGTYYQWYLQATNGKFNSKCN